MKRITRVFGTRKRIALAALSIVCLTLLIGSALATPPTGFTATPLARGTIGHLDASHNGFEVERDHGSADIAMATVTIEPGGSTGWHHHPGVVLVAVKSGTGTHYDSKCNKHVFQAGDAFVEASNEAHVVRNNGSVDAVFQVAFLVPTRTPATGLLIDEPQPEDCSIE
jgi:quercetin dioxygenase-like cupin family protein